MRTDQIMFQPVEGWVGDVIPFYHDGSFWLFYLHDWRDPDRHGEGLSWHLVRTRDLLSVEDLGVVLAHGSTEEQDLFAATGSIIEVGGRFHLFYTGFNPRLRDSEGLAREAVMHAVSEDLINWRRLRAHAFFAPKDRYEVQDWRDPFVFQDPRSGNFGMLLASRTREGASRRRGCTAYCGSADLKSWRVEAPFWSPRLFFMHECPDLFQIGDWWYLVYSEFSDCFATRYRMSRSLDGPWLAASADTLDGRAFYAAKTATDGLRRYAFGWIATKAGEVDSGAWQWGGTLAIHEVVQRPDGALNVMLPDPIRQSFRHELGLEPRPVAGDWMLDARAAQSDSRDGFASAVMSQLPENCLISGTITFDSGTRACGLMLRVGPDGDEGYYLRLEPLSKRFVLDRWPRRPPCDHEHEHEMGGEENHALELERSMELNPGRPYRIEVVLDGTACIVYLDSAVAMSARLYDHSSGDWGIFVREGAAKFGELSVRTR
jgi:beta-fructofuranosidase